MAQAKTLKVKKKHWYSIIAPKLFREQIMGEIPLDDPKKGEGRAITINLMELINDVKKQNINIKFIVNKAEGDKLFTEIVGYETIPTYIRRLVRKGRERIDFSFVCLTADNKAIRIKPLFITRGLIKGSLKATLIKKSIEYLARTIRKMSYDAFTQELVFGRFQKGLDTYLRKIHPLKMCDIRMMSIEKEKKETTIEIEEEKEEKEEAEEQEKTEKSDEAKEENIKEPEKDYEEQEESN